MPRVSGILLHPTSLPGRFGIGELGPEARRFVDFLGATGQGLWQVLPLGPTGYGDSPYQCLSAFAGNPLLISLEELRQDRLLTATDLKKAPAFPEAEVDYGAVIQYKLPLLKRAFERFGSRAPAAEREAFAAFCLANGSWLDDYALFAAIKDAEKGQPWHRWDRPTATRAPEALARRRRELAREIDERRFWQYQFFKQWRALRGFGAARGVRMMGDMPIFVAHDSADVWAHPDLFRLAKDGSPAFVAGVPPDYFSATGQRWGNPLYRWETMARTGHSWWIERFRATLAQVDLVRLDHFRGFEAYWEVPGSEPTAEHGRWVKGPGASLFDALRAALGDLPIVAENLGVITPEVEAIRERLGFPGMAVLQFAFGGDSQGSSFRPHNYSRHLVVYTGTHDNDTCVGWWASQGESDSTRTAEGARGEKDFARAYLGTDGRDIHWAMIRAALGSVADTAIIPLQDVLGLGSEARMNRPAQASGNWRWRVRGGALTDELQDRLKRLTVAYGRAAPTASLSPG